MKLLIRGTTPELFIPYCTLNLSILSYHSNLLNTVTLKYHDDIAFELSAEDFDWVMRAANVLSSPHIVVESDGDAVFVTTTDLANSSAHTDSLEIAKGNGNKYRMFFKTENFKMLAGGYDVQISSKGISHFKHKTLNIQYWIATEKGSTFDKAKK